MTLRGLVFVQDVMDVISIKCAEPSTRVSLITDQPGSGL